MSEPPAAGWRGKRLYTGAAGQGQTPRRLPAARGAGRHLPMHRQVILRLVFWVALALALVLALNPKPPHVPGEPSDKVQHIIAFLMLTGLAVLAYPRARRLPL